MSSKTDFLLRLAQGDAFAAATEYIKHPRDDAVLEQALKMDCYVKHPTHHLAAGKYTDDTQMSIAVSEALLSGSPLTRHLFAQHFVSAFCRDPRDGYSRGFQYILETAKNAHSPFHEFMKLVTPESTKNGACMRSVPLGTICDIHEMLDTAKIQASVTHNTPEGIWSSQAVSLMSHYMFFELGDSLNLIKFLKSHLPASVSTINLMPTPQIKCNTTEWNSYLVSGLWSGRVTGRIAPLEGYHGIALSTVKAVLTLLTEKRSMIDIMRQVISWGGDTDSVASIAWGIAAMSKDIDQSLEPFWLYGLEPGGLYGADFLTQLGSKLANKSTASLTRA